MVKLCHPGQEVLIYVMKHAFFFFFFFIFKLYNIACLCASDRVFEFEDS